MGQTEFVERFAHDVIRKQLKQYPLVLVEGPRGSGKTALVRKFEDQLGRYVSFDQQHNGAMHDSRDLGFMVRLGTSAVVDEAQLCPHILQAIKGTIEHKQQSGRYLLACSSSARILQEDSYASQICRLTVLPLAQAEILGGSADFFFSCMLGESKRVLNPQAADADLDEAIGLGGYPSLRKIKLHRKRSAWLRNYSDLVARIDIPAVSSLRTKLGLNSALRLLAKSAAKRLNIESVRRELGLNYATAAKLIRALADLHIIKLMPAYDPASFSFSRSEQRKLHFADTGLLSAALGIAPGSGARSLLGSRAAVALYKNFACSEIIKLCAALDVQVEFGYWRDRVREVDLVVRHEGKITGIQALPATSVRKEDFAGLYRLADAGASMRCGLIVYAGNEAVSYGYKSQHGVVLMQAVPLNWLWARRPDSV